MFGSDAVVVIKIKEPKQFSNQKMCNRDQARENAPNPSEDRAGVVSGWLKKIKFPFFSVFFSQGFTE